MKRLALVDSSTHPDLAKLIADAFTAEGYEVSAANGQQADFAIAFTDSPALHQYRRTYRIDIQQSHGAPFINVIHTGLVDTDAKCAESILQSALFKQPLHSSLDPTPLAIATRIVDAELHQNRATQPLIARQFTREGTPEFAYFAARDAEERGAYVNAAEHFLTAIDLAPERHRYPAELSRLLLAHPDIRASLREKYLREDPRGFFHHLYERLTRKMHGKTLYDSHVLQTLLAFQENHDAVISIAEDIVRDDPVNTDHRDLFIDTIETLADAYHAKGKDEDALRVLNRLLLPHGNVAAGDQPGYFPVIGAEQKHDVWLAQPNRHDGRRSHLKKLPPEDLETGRIEERVITYLNSDPAHLNFIGVDGLQDRIHVPEWVQLIIGAREAALRTATVAGEPLRKYCEELPQKARPKCLERVVRAMTHLQGVLSDRFTPTLDQRNNLPGKPYGFIGQKVRESFERFRQLFQTNLSGVDDFAQDVDTALRNAPPCFYCNNVGGANPSNWRIDAQQHLGRFDFEDDDIRLGFSKIIGLLENFGVVDLANLKPYLASTWIPERLRRCKDHPEDALSTKPKKVIRKLLDHTRAHGMRYDIGELDSLILTQSLASNLRVASRFALTSRALLGQLGVWENAYDCVKDYSTQRVAETRRFGKRDQLLLQHYKNLKQQQRHAEQLAFGRAQLAERRLEQTNRTPYKALLKPILESLEKQCDHRAG